MANIPDEAIDRMQEVSKSAFVIYVYLCRRRNGKTGKCFPSLKTIASECNLDYSYASVMRSELVKNGWIELDEKGHIKLLMGFGKSKDEVLENPKGSLENPKHVLENPKRYIKEYNHQSNHQSNQCSKRTSSPPKTRGSRLPMDFAVTTTMTDWANLRGLDIDLDTETEKFVNYWTGVSGQRGVKLDWVATWRNWMLQAMEYKKRGTNQQQRNSSNREKLSEYQQLFDKYN